MSTAFAKTMFILLLPDFVVFFLQSFMYIMVHLPVSSVQIISFGRILWSNFI